MTTLRRHAPLAVAAAAALLVPAVLPVGAAAAATATSCTLTVPRTVVLGSTPAARLGACPTGLKVATWNFERVGGARTALSFLLDRTGRPTATPARARTTTSDTPGVYRLRAGQRVVYYERTGGQAGLGRILEVPLRASGTITARYGSRLQVAITHPSGRTTVTVHALRSSSSRAVPAAGQQLRVLRNGKVVRTVRLGRTGAVSVTVAGAAKATYRVELAGNATTWGTTATVRR